MTFKNSIPTAQKTLRICHKYTSVKWEIYQSLRVFMIDLPTEFVTNKILLVYALFADIFPTGFDNHHQGVLK
jgi:hypothetical protein